MIYHWTDKQKHTKNKNPNSDYYFEYIYDKQIYIIHNKQI